MLPAARFQTTSWSMVFAAAGEDDAAARDALNDLCARYWYPVYAYVRRSGATRHDAEDLTQAFFERLLERRDFRTADPRRGKFRSFILGALEHFMANERDRARAQKRGGGQAHVPIDFALADAWYAADAAPLTPDQLFERRWAVSVLESAVRELRDAGEPEHLLPFLTGEHSYAAAAAEHGMSDGALRVAVHRLRRRFRDRLRRLVAQTVDDAAAIDDEIRFLIEAVSA